MYTDLVHGGQCVPVLIICNQFCAAEAKFLMDFPSLHSLDLSDLKDDIFVGSIIFKTIFSKSLGV